MAGFCTHCGKPLADGEVCACQQQKAAEPTQEPVATATPVSPAPQAQPNGANGPQIPPQAPIPGAVPPVPQPAPSPFAHYFKALWAEVVAYVKAPMATAKSAYEKGDPKFGGVYAGVTALISGFLTMSLISSLLSALMGGLGVGGLWSDYGAPRVNLFGPFVTFFLFAAALYFATCGVITVIGAIGKQKVSFTGLMAAVGLHTIPTTCVGVVALLFSFFAPSIAIFLLIANLIIWSVTSYDLAKTVCPVQGNKAGLINAGLFALVFIILFGIFFSIVM